MNKMYCKDSLIHYGIKGQKWGIRRFQYENGSYTEEGKERYGRINGSNSSNSKISTKEKSNNDTAKKILIGAGIVSLVAVGGYLAYKHSRDEVKYPNSWPKNALKFGDPKAVKVLEEQFKKEVEPLLSSEEKESILQYTKSEYDSINYFLETGGSGESPYRSGESSRQLESAYKRLPEYREFARHNAENIENAINKTTTKQDMIVDRRTHFSNLRGMFGGISAKELAQMLSEPDKAIGRTLQFDGFCSTTIVQSEGNKLFGNCNLHILVPKGSKAAYVAPISNVKTEGEVLLQRGSKFRLVKMENFNGNKDFVYGSTVDLFLELIND